MSAQTELALVTEVSHLDVIAANGVPFRAVIDRSQPGAFITFYDRRHISGLHLNGQMAASYYIESLLSPFAVRDKEGLSTYADTGLCLHNGVPDWNIDARTMAIVLLWIRNVMGGDL